MPLHRARGRLTAILTATLVALGLATLCLPGVAEAATASPTAHPTPSATSTPIKVKYYVVQASTDGTPEFLFELAQRFLGDGNRYPEIFALNKNSTQPGGARFTDPAVLEPGWILQMPDDAKGPGIKTETLGALRKSRHVQSAPVASGKPAVQASPRVTLSPIAAPGNQAAAASPAAAAAAGAGSSGSSWLEPVLLTVGALVVAGGVAVGVVLLLRRRRARADRDQPFDDSLLRGDTSAAWTVDRALRVLLAACERAGVAVPAVTGAFIEGSALRLRLADPAAPAPAPWHASDEGLSWTSPLAQLQAEEASTGSTDHFARLVNLGISESGRVLVDFSAAGGLISLDGPTRARHEVLRRWLGELTQNPWSDDPRVVMVGNGLPQPEQAEYRSALDQVVPELVHGQGGVLVLSQAPSASERDMLAARFADPAFGWVVIVLGAVPGARWRFTAADDGWLRSGFLPDVRFDEQMAVRRGRD